MNDSDSKERRFDCILNGVTKRLAWDEAHTLLHTSTIGWILPIMWLRCSLGTCRSGILLDDSTRAATQFGFQLLSKRRGLLLTRDEHREALDKRYLGNNAFHARARRFAAVLGDLSNGQRPFEYIMMPDAHDGMPAYRMKADATWIIVLGTANGNGKDVDWQALTIPPDSKS